MELQVTYLTFVEVEYNTPSSLDARPATSVLWRRGNEAWLKQRVDRLTNAVEGIPHGFTLCHGDDSFVSHASLCVRTPLRVPGSLGHQAYGGQRSQWLRPSQRPSRYPYSDG